MQSAASEKLAIACSSAPTAGSQGNSNITPKAMPWQEKPLHRTLLRRCASSPGGLSARLHVGPSSSSETGHGPTQLEGDYRPRLQEPLPVRERLATEWPVRGLLNWLPCGSGIWIRGAPAMDASSSGSGIA